MIVEFSVKNFASIRDKQVLSFVADKNTHLEDYYTIKAGDLRLLKLCLVYGANASGKTTVLKALDFLDVLVNRQAKSKTSPIQYQPFLLDDFSKDEDSEIEITFYANGHLYFYKVVFNRRCIVREELRNGPHGALIISRTTNQEKQIASLRLGRNYQMEDSIDLKLIKKSTVWNESFIQGYRRVNIDFSPLFDVSSWFDSYLRRMLKPTQSLTTFVLKRIEEGDISPKDVLPIIQKADLNICNFYVEKKRFSMGDDHDSNNIPEGASIEIEMGDDDSNNNTIVYRNLSFTHKNAFGKEYSNISYANESLGTQRYFGLAGLLSLLIKNSTSFCIDELESSLHPDLFKHFILSFCVNVKHSQLLATTHHSGILNNRDLFRNDMIVFTEKDENMSTQVYKLSDFGTSVVRDTSNIYNAYVAGRLGGIPDLGDYYIGIGDESE